MEGKYIGMYMKGSKDEMKQGAGNNGEVVNVGMGFCGGYETSSLPKNSNIDIKWLGYVGMNKYNTERESVGGVRGKAEFSGSEIGLDVEGGLKIGSKEEGIIRPYIGIGIRKIRYDEIEEKGTLAYMKIKSGSFDRCVWRIGVEGNKEISKKVEIEGKVEYERVMKGEVGRVEEEVEGSIAGIEEGKDKVGLSGGVRYKVRKDIGLMAGLSGYKAGKYNEVGVNVGAWFKF
jgi:uncharacterized protein with beta-barrel porin domain